MAPEVMNSGKVSVEDFGKCSYNGYGQSADWWSLGVIVYRMKFLRKPFVQPENLTNNSAHTEKETKMDHLYMER